MMTAEEMENIIKAQNEKIERLKKKLKQYNKLY